ncbi:MAG TPA: transporter [Candidatus Deferrimicrobiaceae bacterium]|nr:transporter [Candidatus Deferrimicrobiaceae bacterium]
MSGKRSACLIAAISIFASISARGEDVRKIRDNSFLVEEAYNQEKGVVQHIQTFQYMEGGSWAYGFTQEWPVPKETHQLSYSIPVLHVHDDGTDTGIGDVALNYRYQAILKDPVAFAPRLSLILPTGNHEKGRGNGAVGYQANLPLSVELSEKWVTHWNLGATFVPDSKGPNDGKADTVGFNCGAGIVYLLSENFNVLLEAAGTSSESVEGIGQTSRLHAFFINPGVRFAMNFESGLQIVPGISVPIGVGPSGGEYGAFLYLSLEHPLF